MAIKVLQGLIDTGRPGAQPSPSQSSTAQSPSPLQSQIAQTSHATLTSAASISHAISSSEATLVTVRAGRPSGDSERVRDADRAQRLAEDLADGIRGKENGADGAHRSLDAANAREHFT